MGQIRIAVYDPDSAYTERFCQYMNAAAGQEYAFLPVCDKDQLNHLISARETEGVLVSDALREEYPLFIGDIHVGYLTEEPMEEAGEIFRYQSRREILEVLGKLLENEDTSVKLLVFAGASAGCGCSTAAASCAQKLSREDKRVLYINMSSLGDTGAIFQRGNPKDFQYLLKELETGGDLDAAMAAVLNRDTGGVYYYDNLSAPLSLMNITRARMEVFLKRLIDSGEFRYIIIDSSFSVNHGLLEACRMADRVVFVSDGVYTSNQRLHKIWSLFQMMGNGLCSKSILLYNKFHEKYGRLYENPELPVAGTIGVLSPAGPSQMAEQMTDCEALGEVLR
ncbi:MAG: hypothetical protein HFI67_07565 [Lachnospiraceae bacterium]|jgi:hypothetical protein|nr:hypothetical protein [Lachnospiraceae bacterium]